MEAIAVASKSNRKKRTKKIPDYLIYEIMDGKPIYYKGYKDVLNNTKKPADIMGTNSLQWIIQSYFLDLLYHNLSRDFFRIASGEPGLHINTNNNLAGDILVFKKEDIPPAAITTKYVNIPALLHIEVDVSADMEKDFDLAYLQKKVNKLMDFGTKKILWIFSTTQQILKVTQKDEWHWHSWNDTMELTSSLNFNIGEYLKKEGVVLDKME